MLNAAEFVNPAQLVNQPARRTYQMDPTIGQQASAPAPLLANLAVAGHQLMGGNEEPPLGGGSHPPPPLLADLAASHHQLIGGEGAPLGSPMCSTLGDFPAPDEAGLFSLTLPLCGDMHA